MFDESNQTVHDAVIAILAAIYETGLVEEVDLGIVLQLFGSPSDSEAPIVSFADPEWIKQYVGYKQSVNGGGFENVKVIDLNDDDPEAQTLIGVLSEMGIIPEDTELSEEETLSDRGPGPDEIIH